MATQVNELELSTAGQLALRELLVVWLEFERRLEKVPLIRRLEKGTFTLEDYKTLLVNLRAQVIEGSRWISRAASSFTAENAELRSAVIKHAFEEHRDYEMIEKDYISIGGSRQTIINAQRNIGSEALSAFLMQQASLPNPVDLLGAMFIIEGLGQKMADKWAKRIQHLTGISEQSTQFLSYHGCNDDGHIAKMHSILNSEAITMEAVPRILKTARVVARLYVLQLEELDNV
jgi:3-oxoacyl-[acyl-carrier-protein] synthase III